MLMTHLQEMGRLIVRPSTAKELLFTIKMGTFRDSQLSRGDLGNQMFQLTAALAYAWRNNAAVVIENPTYENGIKLDCFKLENIIISQNIVPTVRFKEQAFAVTDPREAQMFFYSNFEDNSVVELEGYFQNWRFAHMVENQLRDALSFKEPYAKYSNSIFEKIKSTFPDYKIAALHFRGFDQSDSPGFHKGSEINHPPIPIDFYDKACKNIQDKLNQPCKFLVFSNNAEDAKKAIADRSYSKDILFTEDFLEEADSTIRTDNDNLSTLSAPVDLCLMTKCDAHIISNSTFAWWGAWLAASKHVITPARCRWFGEHLGKHNLTDLYPPWWEEIWYPPHLNSFISNNNFTG